MHSLGIKKIHAALKVLVKEMEAGGPGGEAMPAARSAEEAAAAEKAKARAEAAKKAEAERKEDAAAAADVASGRGLTLSLTERFGCRPADLFDALTSVPRLSAITLSKVCGGGVGHS